MVDFLLGRRCGMSAGDGICRMLGVSCGSAWATTRLDARHHRRLSRGCCGVSLACESHDDSLQMPLDYVRFPYQARYPGDNEGDLLSTYIVFAAPHRLLSNCRLRILRNSHLREVALGTMPWQRE